MVPDASIVIGALFPLFQWSCHNTPPTTNIVNIAFKVSTLLPTSLLKIDANSFGILLAEIAENSIFDMMGVKA